MEGVMREPATVCGRYSKPSSFCSAASCRLLDRIMVKSGNWQSTELAFNMEDSSKIAKKPLKPTFLLHTRHILLGGECRDDLRPQKPKKSLWETTK
jgi:hypothetical protein